MTIVIDRLLLVENDRKNFLFQVICSNASVRCLFVFAVKSKASFSIVFLFKIRVKVNLHKWKLSNDMADSRDENLRWDVGMV